MNTFEIIKTVRLTEKGTRQADKYNQYTVVADTRPYIDDPVPAKLTLFLSRPMAKGAVASIGIVTVIDESSKPYRENAGHTSGQTSSPGRAGSGKSGSCERSSCCSWASG